MIVDGNRPSIEIASGISEGCYLRAAEMKFNIRAYIDMSTNQIIEEPGRESITYGTRDQGLRKDFKSLLRTHVKISSEPS